MTPKEIMTFIQDAIDEADANRREIEYVLITPEMAYSLVKDNIVRSQGKILINKSDYIFPDDSNRQAMELDMIFGQKVKLGYCLAVKLKPLMTL